ncbi:protein of unknown function [Acidithiobacillus ferrivorans]|uniref:Uncharacterized protein n=1 Tax=Acidithiobacillus ferrivorans TaxID=160808 RepID=A0ABY1MPA9_9PROT|nr:protein of unknown function [Acidithiobacillus ferrivorans]
MTEAYIRARETERIAPLDRIVERLEDVEKRRQQIPANHLIYWSGREDLNLRPPEPHSGALPGCATPRETGNILSKPDSGQCP